MQTISVDQCIIDLTGCCTIEGHTLLIPAREDWPICSDVYAQFKRFLGKYGAKWTSAINGFTFPFPVSALVTQMLETGRAPKPNPHAFHPTPAEVVLEMLDAAGILGLTSVEDWRMWEPQGGSGAIVKRLMDIAGTGTVVETCEIDPLNRATLRDIGATLVADDALLHKPIVPYDRILMNPPFSVTGDKHAYITHIEHALKYLAPWGRLVAIVPSSFLTNTDKRTAEFRQGCFEDAGFTCDIIASGIFETTSIETALIVLNGVKVATDIESTYDGYAHEFAARFDLFASNDGALYAELCKAPLAPSVQGQADIFAEATQLNRKWVSRFCDKVLALAAKSGAYLPECYREDYYTLIDNSHASYQ